MTEEIKRSTVVDFIWGTLPGDQMLLIADLIENNSELTQIYKEEKERIRIQHYVDKELSQYETELFEEELKTNKKLVSEVNLHKDIDEYFSLKGTLDEIHQNLFGKRSILLYARRYKNWIAAASVVLFLALGSSFFIKSYYSDSLENRLFKTYYSPFNDYTDMYIINSNSFCVARQKYLDGEYKNALFLLKEQPSFLTIETERDFFIALSLIEMGQYKGAIEYFEQTLNKKEEFEYIPQIKWYMGLCYLKTKNQDKAINIFQSIVDNSEYNYKKAKRILEKLES